MEQSGKLPQQACTNDVLVLIPKNVTSERPIALMPTLIRWWEAMRASEVMKVAAKVIKMSGTLLIGEMKDLNGQFGKFSMGM